LGERGRVKGKEEPRSSAMVCRGKDDGKVVYQRTAWSKGLKLGISAGREVTFHTKSSPCGEEARNLLCVCTKGSYTGYIHAVQEKSFWEGDERKRVTESLYRKHLINRSLMTTSGNL